MRQLTDKYVEARITQRKDVAPDLWIVRIEPLAPFAFQPGQYATLGIFEPDGMIERPYSICSAPHERELEFFIELVPGGELTPHLHELKVGDAVALRRNAKGKFAFDTNGPRKNHLMLSTVTGIAPFVSFVRSRLHTGAAGDHRVFVVHGGSRSWELGYRDELESAMAGAPWLQYVPTVSRPWDDGAWRGEMGRVDDLVRLQLERWGLTPDNTIAYLCGHPQMIENCRGILQRRGFPKEALRWEAYWVPPKTAPAV